MPRPEFPFHGHCDGSGSPVSAVRVWGAELCGGVRDQDEQSADDLKTERNPADECIDARGHFDDHRKFGGGRIVDIGREVS